MVRVLVVDDDAMVRRLLRTILEQSAISVVAEAADGDEVLTAVQAHHPDVVLMDLRMERISGVRATKELARLSDPPGVLALTSLDTEAVILDAVRAGAQGFLAKDAEPAQIVAAVRSVAAGDGALSPRAARTVMQHVQVDETAQSKNAALQRIGELTQREREIATEVAAGLTNAQIAERSYLSEATVKTHLGRAMTKLQAQNRVQLALVIDRAGLGPV